MASSSTTTPSPVRWLLHGTWQGSAGLGHTLSEYLSGVALAAAYDFRLIYQPVWAGHGMYDMLDAFLSLDERGLPAPLYTPEMAFDGMRQQLRSIERSSNRTLS